MQLTNTLRLIVQKNIIQSWKFSHYQKDKILQNTPNKLDQNTH